MLHRRVGEFGAGAGEWSRLTGLQNPDSREHGAHLRGGDQAHFSILSPMRGRNKKGRWVDSERT